MSDPRIDSKAAAILQTRLDPSEKLIWAESPNARRMITSSTRAFFSTPLHWGPPILLAVVLVWRLASANDPSPIEWVLLAIALYPVLAMAVDLLAIPFLVLPFFTPIAYGATRSYFLLYRGLIFQRLVRIPVSLVRTVELVKWGGHAAIVFRMDADQKVAFSYFHTDDPAATLAAIESIVPAHNDPSLTG